MCDRRSGMVSINPPIHNAYSQLENQNYSQESFIIMSQPKRSQRITGFFSSSSLQYPANVLVFDSMLRSSRSHMRDISIQLALNSDNFHHLTYHVRWVRAHSPLHLATEKEKKTLKMNKTNRTDRQKLRSVSRENGAKSESNELYLLAK